jgi:hypothetical protein
LHTLRRARNDKPELAAEKGVIMKSSHIITIFFVSAFCMAFSGCGGNPNCIRIDAGRPFIAQAGLRYYIEEFGPKYEFNRNAAPDAQVLYVEPYCCQTLEPGGTYVLFLDPDYLAKRRQRQEEMDSFNQSMKEMGNSFEKMGGMFKTPK